MTVAEYTLSIDWNNDGDFTDTGEGAGVEWNQSTDTWDTLTWEEAPDDVTSDWVSANITRGFSGPLARVATTGRATFILDNTDKTYSPPLDVNVKPRREVKFDMTYGGTTETLFRGYIDSIRPQVGQFRDKLVAINCVDAMAILDRYEGAIALQVDAFADDIIDEVVSAVYTPPSTNYQSGINPFPTSGDQWSYASGYNTASPSIGARREEATQAAQKIQDVCSSDWGYFFIAGDGAPTFYNRHQTTLDDTTELTLDDTMLEMDYTYGVSDIYNYIEVTCLPRVVGETYEVLGRLSQQEAPIIEASDSRTFVLRFRDPSNPARGLGGYSCLTPVASTDYEATDDEGGNGADETSNVSVNATFYGDRAELECTNAAAYPVFIQKLQVRGLAVRVREPVTLIAQDATSISAYEKRNLPIMATLMSRQSDAQSLANYLNARYKDPQHDLRNIVINPNKDTTFIEAARDLELLDKVSITETQTGHSAFEGHIYWMQHRILNDDRNYRNHTLSFAIKEAYTYASDAFTIGTSTLSDPSSDILIY